MCTPGWMLLSRLPNDHSFLNGKEFPGHNGMAVVDQKENPPPLLFSNETAIPSAKPGTLELAMKSINGHDDEWRAHGFTGAPGSLAAGLSVFCNRELDTTRLWEEMMREVRNEGQKTSRFEHVSGMALPLCEKGTI